MVLFVLIALALSDSATSTGPPTGTQVTDVALAGESQPTSQPNEPGYTQYATRARYWRSTRAATDQPTTVSTSTTAQCRSG